MKRIQIFLLLTLACLPGIAQQISGKVVNEAQLPLSGVTIQLKGSKKFTQTANSGNFSLKHPSTLHDSLIVSATGYETISVAISNSPLLITLRESNITLTEVMINTGYQDIPRERSTGTFERIDKRTLDQQVSPDILSRLKGTSSILFDGFSSRPGISIRGMSTINGPKDPLIVVDDFPYEGTLNNINPNDIESISILKDAAAASVWGARAGNGVIVITTKKGKLNQPLRVTYNSNFTVIAEPDLWKLDMISTKDYIEVEQYLFSKGFGFSDTAATTKPAFTPVYEILFRQRKGQITQQQALSMIDSLKEIDVRDAILKYFYKPAFNQQYAIGISGGTEKYGFTINAGYDKTRSDNNSIYNRYTLRSDHIFKVSPRLQLSYGLAVTHVKSSPGNSTYSDLNFGSGLLPYGKLADSRGNALPFPKGVRQTYKDTTGAGKLLDWNYYPLTEGQHITTTNITNHLSSYLGLNYKIIKGLAVDLKYRFEYQGGSGEKLNGINSYFTRDMINRYSQLNRSTGVVTYAVPKGDILQLSYSNMKAHNGRGLVNYSNSWGKHSVSAIAGAEIRRVVSTRNAYNVYGFDNERKTSANVDFVNTHLLYVNGSRQSISSGISFGEQTRHFISTFSNAAYTYNNRYTVSVSGRKDASNLFGVNTNDKWNILWSAGGAWSISKENFYHLKWLPVLRLRGSSGVSGNVDQTKSAVTTIRYSSATAIPTNFPFANLGQAPNPELRWEKVKMFNLSIDFETMKQRVTGTLSWFHKKGTDLFGQAPIDPTTGVGVVFSRNVASMIGSGFDVELQTKNIDRAIKWSTGLILTYYADHVTDYFISSPNPNNFVVSGGIINAMVGKPVFSIFSYKWAGLSSTGDPQGFVNGQVSTNYNALTASTITFDDLKYNGRAMPPVYGSVSNTLNWKGIGVTANIQFKLGHYFKKNALTYTQLYNNGVGTADFARRWQHPGDEAFTSVPSMIYPSVSRRDQFYNSASINIARADHFRLQYIHVSYDLPAKLISKWKVRELQLYCNAGNLGLIWRANKFGIDPESPELPFKKSFAAGLRASF